MGFATNLVNASKFNEDFQFLCVQHSTLIAMEVNYILTVHLMFLDAEWDSVESIVTTASAIRAACMAPANSHGNATAKRVGEASSVTKVSL